MAQFKLSHVIEGNVRMECFDRPSIHLPDGKYILSICHPIRDLVDINRYTSYQYVIPYGISSNDGTLPVRAFISIESMRKIPTKSPQEIHDMKPHTGFWFGVELRFSIDMVPLTGKCTRLFYQPAVERQLSEAISSQVIVLLFGTSSGFAIRGKH